MRKKIIIGAIIVILLAAGGIYTRETAYIHSEQQQAAIHAAQQKIPTVMYKGENGQNALTLLKQSTSVQQDH